MMTKVAFSRQLLAGCLVLLLAGSCQEKPPTFDVPATYAFNPMDVSGQETRLAMLNEMSAYGQTGHAGAVLNLTRLQNMFRNTGDAFTDPLLNTSSKQLRDKVFSPDQGWFDQAIVQLTAASNSAGAAASNGQAGILSSGSKAYLVDENGVEWLQLLEKGLMGAVCYYQALGNYLSPEGINIDNELVEPTEGTAMEHHWDEAWGYTAFPADFASGVATEDLVFWAKYAAGRDASLPGLSTRIATNFRTGRAAIGAGDFETRDAMIDAIHDDWELVSATTAIHYLNAALADFGDDAIRCHVLSEAWAFGRTLAYGPQRRISQADLDAFDAFLGADFYAITPANVIAARDLLAENYAITNPAIF